MYNIQNQNSNHVYFEQQTQTKAQTVFGKAYLIIGAALIGTVVVSEIYKIVKEAIHEKKNSQSEEELLKKISDKFGKQVADLANDTDLAMRKSLIYRLALANETEQNIVNYILENYKLDTEQMKQILGGAHVRLDDGGKAYDVWKRDLGGDQRISSHDSEGTQLGLRGYFVKELLYAKVKDNDKTYTWFQLEKNPVSLGNILRHTADYLRYCYSGKNQGPYGVSSYTDKNPLVLTPKLHSVTNNHREM